MPTSHPSPGLVCPADSGTTSAPPIGGMKIPNPPPMGTPIDNVSWPLIAFNALADITSAEMPSRAVNYSAAEAAPMEAATAMAAAETSNLICMTRLPVIIYWRVIISNIGPMTVLNVNTPFATHAFLQSSHNCRGLYRKV